MTKLTWGDTGDRLFEAGVDHGVLFPYGSGGYEKGVAWNGLTTVTRTPSGAEPTNLYADNKKYLTLRSAEEFGFTIEAYSSPVEFDQCDGSASPAPGVHIGQQGRRMFAFSWRSRVGNDVEGTDFGYKIHIAYGATASPSERSFETINDSPTAQTLSWEAATTAIEIDGFKPTAILTIDSTTANAQALQSLEAILYGTAGQDARLPLPDEVVALFAGTGNVVTPTQPSFAAATGVITIPTVPGVQYIRADTNKPVTGNVTITKAGDTLGIKALPTAGNRFPEDADDYWTFKRTV